MKRKVEKINIQLVGVLNVIVFLAFFFAKIYDKIDWSWWWIFSPLWIPFAIGIGIITICVIIYYLLILFSLILKLWK